MSQKPTVRKSQKTIEQERFIDAIRACKGLAPLYDTKGERKGPTLLSNGIFPADPRQAGLPSGCSWLRTETL
jgi:hypothetical protein